MARRDRSKPCLQFRHDDDDAIVVDFVEKLRQAAQDCAPMMRKHRTVGIDFNNGYVAEVSSQGISAASIYRPFYVASLGMYISANCGATIHNFMHERIPRFMPCVTFNDPDMFVRTHNGYNDSRQKPVKHIPVEPLTPEQETLFAVDSKTIRSVFSAT